jgi:D-beta-D-heptose 7-phosphate kinase/D-beta-D-heptose 1-phosphate adenosyltransferase
METPGHLKGLKPDNAITFGDWRHPYFQSLCGSHRDGNDGWILGCLNGCFDLLHLGHVNLIQQAVEYEKNGKHVFLVMLLNSDSSATKLKGPNRPIVPLAARMWQAAMLRGVAAVAGFDEDTPKKALSVLKPNTLFKGAEYKMRVVPGAEHCGEVVFFPETPGYRTTELERRIRG